MRRGVRYFEIIVSYVQGLWKMAIVDARLMYALFSLSLSIFFFPLLLGKLEWEESGDVYRNLEIREEFTNSFAVVFFPFFFWEAMEKGGVNKFLYSLSEIIILDYWGVVEGNEGDFFFSSFFCWKILDILRIVHYNSFIKNFWDIRRKKERIAFLFKKIGNCHSFTIPLLKVFKKRTRPKKE